MADKSLYVFNGTCDACARGPVKLRAADPGDAWICEECSDHQDEAIAAAAAVLGVPVEQMSMAIIAYESFFYDEAQAEAQAEESTDE